ncbi:phage major capsid protein [Bradyrhizobium cenepequi]
MTFPIAGSGTTPPLFPVGSTANALGANGFIPEIWSGKLIEKFYASTVLGAISNTDYEGEIKNQGDKVRIRTKPTITISDYRADGLLSLQRPEGNVIDLLIDKGKYFNTILDDVMDVQSDLNLLNMWSDDAGEQMKITIDTNVLAGILGGAAATNKGATAGAITGNINLGVTATGPLSVVARSPDTGEVEILDALLRLGQALDENNIPETGRWVVLPTWAATLIKKSELREAYLSGDGTSMLRNGRIGMVDRFTLYTSNLLPHGTAGGLAAGEYAMFAGHAHGLTFASQMTKMETLRSESTFGTIMRGLQVFGYKVVDGTALAQAIITPGS